MPVTVLCLIFQAVYQMPTETDDINKSVGLALQRVFYDLQFRCASGVVLIIQYYANRKGQSFPIKR